MRALDAEHRIAPDGGRIITIGLRTDDQRSVEALGRVLTRHGYDIRVTTCSVEAIEACIAQPADVLVIDVASKPDEGREVCVALRQAGITTPVLFLSASRDIEDLLAAFAVGADDYLTKPVDTNELIARIRALNRRNCTSEGRRKRRHTQEG